MKQFEELAAISAPLGHPRPIMCVVGPPGAGKTTFAIGIAGKLQVKALETSALLRLLVHERKQLDDDDRTYIEQCLRKNQQVDDASVLRIILDKSFHRGNSQTVLDGFPRTMNAAHALNKFAMDNDRPVLLFHVYADRGVCRSRYIQKHGNSKKTNAAFQRRLTHYTDVERAVVNQLANCTTLEIENQ